MTIVGPGTPYLSPEMLMTEPTGISWDTIPSKAASPQQKRAAQLNICQAATSAVDEFCQVPLRATIDVETLTGPGNNWRVQILSNGTARVLLSRPPIVTVLSATSNPATQFPAVPVAINRSQFKIEIPLMGVYGSTAPDAGGDSGGQAIIAAPGVFSWIKGRNSTELTVTYLNGWPHTSITADVSSGSSVIPVDDVCGWLGANGVLYDVFTQESVTVSVVTPAVTGALNGPGTLTLSSPLSADHNAGVVVTTLPRSAIEAALLFAISKSLTRGGTTIAAQTMGARQTTTSNQKDTNHEEAECKLQPYRRIL